VAEIRVYGRILSEGDISDLAKHADPVEVGASYSTLPSGLVLHYKLDGPIASEKFENSALPFYHIIDPIGTITNVRGKDLLPNGGLETREGGVQLPGVNDDLHALPFWDASRTVCSWVKPEVLPKNPGDIFPIFEYGTYVGNRLFSLVMAKVGTEDHVGLNVQDTLHTRSITLPLYTWTHLCASFDTSSDVRIYVNGSQIGAPISAPSILTSSTGHIRLGYTENPALNYFPGRIDDVRLYNNALTPFQIRSLATPINEGVIARYDFRSDTQDMSGFGNDLGGLNIDSISNRWKEPVSAYRFNGTSSRISNTSEISKVTDQISFGAWIRPLVVSGTNSLLFYNGNSASNGFGLYLINTTNQLFYLDGGVGGSLSGVNIPIHVWTHVGFIKNGLNIKIFVNGRQVFDDTNAATIEPNGPVSIGSSPSNIEHFNGDISDVILFNRAIAPEEMVALSGYHPWQSTAWDPNPVSSSMIGHYQAESFDSLANNDPITAWLDNSGRNHNLTTVSANPPTYVTGTFPHRSSVRFLDTAEQWVQMDTGFPLDATNFTFFSAHVFDPAIPTTGDRYILNYGNDFNPLQISSNYDDPNFRTVLCRSNDKCADVPPPDAFSKSYPAGTPFFVRYNKLVSNIQVFSNGNLDTNITLTGGFLTNSLLRLGARYNNLATSFFRGNIGEILIFNNQLNTSTNIFGLTDRDYIDCYLSAKYGIRLDPTSTISCP
ncbi:MAG: LamG domain-containing protein, partial [Leptospira sp.]|nr:LamG domain-containing protein [Leptospira sp.]